MKKTEQDKNKKGIEVLTPEPAEKKKLSARVRRNFRYGTNALALIAAVLIIFVVANLVMERFSTSLTLDLTTEKRYSIGDVTREKMNALEQDIEVIALYDRVRGEADSNRKEIIKVLDLYDDFDRITVTYKDPDANPGFILNTVGETNASLYSEGDYIVRCGDKTRRISESEMYVTAGYTYAGLTIGSYKTGLRVEQKLTTAILYVTSEDVPVVYCTTGHGEKSRTNFKTVFDKIESIGCDVQELNLTEIREIPADASVLVFLSPVYDLTNGEYSMVEQWMVQNGGQILFCTDPDQTGTQFVNFNKLLEELFGLTVNSDLVLDEANKIASSQNADDFKGITVSHGPIANSSVFGAYLFSTRSVNVLSVSSANTYIENYPIIQTMDSAVSVSMLDQSKREGVQTVAAAAVNSYYLKPMRAVVFGSTSVISDAYLKNYGSALGTTMGVFAMSVDWMIESYAENAGSLIEAKMFDTTALVIDSGKSRLLAVVAIVGIPLLIIGFGGWVWFRRRHL